MPYTISQIAKSLGIDFQGDGDLRIASVTEPALAGPDDMALAMGPKYAEDLPKGQARAAFLWQGADWQSYGLQAALMAPRPRFALSSLSAMMDRGQGFDTGIHPTAVVSKDAIIGQDVSIGPFCVIQSGAHIGDNSILGPHVYVGARAILGQNTYLREGVKIGADVTIGERFIAQPNAIIGADGFSFVTPEKSAAEAARESLGDTDLKDQKGQAWSRIHSLGGVVIGDDVEIGANSCVDRGTVRATQIGHGVKIDNLAQIGHNVVIGDHTMVCAQVGIAGSSRIGRHVILGGQTGVSDNVFIGDHVVTGGATKVLSNVPAGRVMLGYPAMKMDQQLTLYKAMRKLPKVLADVAKLNKTVAKGD
jgi:UDP-3-O-[3-hydroxymyristoyl] glucosamine N-acyltransferase